MWHMPKLPPGTVISDKLKRSNDLCDTLDYITAHSRLPYNELLNSTDWNKVAEEIKDSYEGKSQPCKHEWVNAGFHFDKWVCKKCDVNKGSNE